MQKFTLELKTLYFGTHSKNITFYLTNYGFRNFIFPEIFPSTEQAKNFFLNIYNFIFQLKFLYDKNIAAI